MIGDHTETTDPLLPARCPECGYLLEGLPDRGVCPECGVGFDRANTIVLYGWLAGNKGQFAAIGTGVRLVLVIGLMTGLHVLERILPFRVGSGLLNFTAAMIVVLYVWIYYKRRLARDELPAPVQLRLTPWGIGYRTGYGSCTLRPWTSPLRTSIKPRRRGYWRLEVWYEASEKTLTASPWLRFAFRCDAETAAQLGERMEAWRTAAVRVEK